MLKKMFLTITTLLLMTGVTYSHEVETPPPISIQGSIGYKCDTDDLLVTFLDENAYLPTLTEVAGCEYDSEVRSLVALPRQTISIFRDNGVHDILIWEVFDRGTGEPLGWTWTNYYIHLHEHEGV